VGVRGRALHRLCAFAQLGRLALGLIGSGALVLDPVLRLAKLAPQALNLGAQLGGGSGIRGYRLGLLDDGESGPGLIDVESGGNPILGPR
jgi:hypothetical protein